MYQVSLLKSKIHGASVTEANLQYRGSLTLDEDLMEAANMQEYERILVVNNQNGERLETYLIKGKRGSGVCCLNGAASRKAAVGDTLIIMSFMLIDHVDSKGWKPIRVFVNHKNKIERIEMD